MLVENAMHDIAVRAPEGRYPRRACVPV